MKHLLSLPSTELLALLTRSRGLLAFDFDGTLAPITAKRDEAAMRPSTAGLLSRLCCHAKCAIISGRSRDDVMRRLGGAQALHVVGNHGLELDSGSADFDDSIGNARQALSALLPTLPGVELEDKRYSLSLHYRCAADPVGVQAALGVTVAGLKGVRAQPGKGVLNLVPANGPNKGDALAALMQREGATQALYAGDDVTDEDVFEHAVAANLVSVRIGSPRRSAAKYYLQGQWEIDHLLHALLTLPITSTP